VLNIIPLTHSYFDYFIHCIYSFCFPCHNISYNPIDIVCQVLYNLNINKRKDNMYLIIKQTDYENLEPSYSVADQTKIYKEAENKVKGYNLIDNSNDTYYHCIELDK